MPRVPFFVEALDKIKKIHEAKNNDYADSNNPFSNFDFTEQVMSIFKNERDKTFIWPIATKIARLSTLLNSGNRPQNESIEDSFLDIATYILLWRCDYLNRINRRLPPTDE
jgi:hypothetical protein